MIPTSYEIEKAFPLAAPIDEVIKLHGDGSPREFFRLRRSKDRGFILLQNSDAGENATYAGLAKHLSQKGVRVPKALGIDPKNGWLLFEDLGDKSLFSAAGKAMEKNQGIQRLYFPAIKLLAQMQVNGTKGFDGGAWPPYDKDIMIEREGMYFAAEFAKGLLGLDWSTEYEQEIEKMADAAANANTDFFMHRDFQSRNILFTPDGPAIIDFQDARRGPLAYDAASLILDPYVDLTHECRSKLKTQYEWELKSLNTVSENFDEEWRLLGAFRLLQALGAFAKLGGRMGKPGFLEHAEKGLEILLNHLGDRGKKEFPATYDLVKRSREAWLKKTEGNRPR